MDHGHEEEKKIHPWQRANFLSRLTFMYTRSIFWKTYITNKLEEEDLYQVPLCYKSEKLGDELENCLENDLETHKVASIYRILWSCYGKEYLFIGLIQLMVRTIVVTTIPMTLSKLVLYFQPYQETISKGEACLYAVLLITLNLFNIIYTHNYMLTITAFGIKVKTAFCSLMYRRSLKLTGTSLSEISTGKIITLMTKDVTAFEKIILYGNDIWIGFAQAGIVCYLIYRKMGIAAVSGVGFLFLVIPFQVYIGKKASNLRLKTAAMTDERLQVTQEVVSAIKLIKMYAWEGFFKKRILDARQVEVGIIAKIFLIKVVILLIGGLTSKIAFYFLVMTYVWLGHTISAELVFFTLTLFQRLRHALSVVVPLGITEFAELHACVNRIGGLFRAEKLCQPDSELISTTPNISLKVVTVAIKDKPIIKNVTAAIESGLTFLTGALGSGKSTLLKTILRDYNLSEGIISVKGRISYASQEPWIFPSTLKQNIVFGEKFEQGRYEEVLRVCALNFDIHFFKEGDNMVIGDKGINLSKGQKARINLARAVYKDCEIYLLDDCLAALDAHVKDHVYNECIRGFLKQKLCVLACNNLEYVQSGDTVMVIDNGTLKSCIKITNKDTKNAIDTTTKVNDKFDDGQANKNNNDTDDEKSRLLDRGKSIYHEVKKSGKVGAENYKRYISYGGGYFMFGTVVLFFVLGQSSKSYAEKMVSRWVDLEENLTYFEANNLTATDEYGKMTENRSLILILFSSLILATTLLYIITSYLFFNFTRKVSNRLHKAMVGSIINAVTTFFDKIFIGNILNRFSNDLAIIDEHFPFDVYEFIEIFLALCGVLTILATVNISFLVPATTVLILLLFIRKCYMPTGRNLQRLESATRSPVVGYVNASLEGLTTIRAFQAERLLIEEFDKHQDHYTSTSFTNKCCVRAFGLAVDTCCTIFIAVIAGYFLTLENDSSVGDVGLAITQAFMLSGLVQYGIRKWADLENKMTSVERVLEYTTTEQEIKNKGLRPLNWPSEGKIQVENLSLSYFNSEECVLKNVNFKIEATQKIGVVGRTGAGKTSIISALFRLYDYKGKIVIDEIDIREIALEFLRRSVAIIPQDPVLFTGTVRSNIDPLASHQDSDIWSAIKKVKLVDLIKSLDMRIADSGSNFSAGQKQLLCLARAIVGRNKILVLDEATANMDDETDALIHGVIEEHFASCTVLTIVHKLQNVLKCDKVMLIESGEVVEYDNPKVLLKNKNGHFYKMIEKAGLLSSK